ncbi:TOPRS ligase, partial [Penelope pileata]|nr:TOPRS ligase [Penelope pileata]
MAAAEAWTCPVCRDVRRDVAYVTPCSHKFCLGCIQRWARLKDSCPLCRTPMTTIKVSVWGGDQYVECLVSPPAVPMPADFQRGTGPRGTAAQAPLPPLLPLQHEAAAQDARPRVGGLLPQQWAALFRERRHILIPVLPRLHRKLSAIPGVLWWHVSCIESLFFSCLCQLGLDREALVQCMEPSLGPMAAPLSDWLIRNIVSRCGREARRLLGLEDNSTAQGQQDRPAATSPHGTLTSSTAPSSSSTAPSVEEIPGTSGVGLHGAAGELPATASPGEREQPREEPGQEAAGPSAQGCSSSAPSQGRECCSGGPQRPNKRRADSSEDDPQPCKRPP